MWPNVTCAECKERMHPQNPEVGFTDLRTKRYYPPICQGCPQKDSPEEMIITLKERIANLESIIAEPGQIPRAFHEELQQTKGQVIFLQNKLNAALEKGKTRQKDQTKKTTYEGLSAEA